MDFFRWYYSLHPIELLDMVVVMRRSAVALGYTSRGILEASTVGSTLPQCAAKTKDLIQYKSGEADGYPIHPASWTVAAHPVKTGPSFPVFRNNSVSLAVRPEAAANDRDQFREKGLYSLYWMYSTSQEQDRRVSVAVAYFHVRGKEIRVDSSRSKTVYQIAAVMTDLAHRHRRWPGVDIVVVRFGTYLWPCLTVRLLSFIRHVLCWPIWR